MIATTSGGNNQTHGSKFIIRFLLYIFIFIAFTAYIYSKIKSSSGENFHLDAGDKESVASAINKGTDKDLEELLQKVDNTLRWIIEKSSDYPSKATEKHPPIPFINWDLIANAEIHILHKLGLYLVQHFQNSTHSRLQHSGQSAYDIIERGYQCKPKQAVGQEGLFPLPSFLFMLAIPILIHSYIEVHRHGHM